jgi:maleylpyruvate isomerase
VRIALALKGVDYEYVPVHLVDEGGKQHTDWFKAMNPMEQVPVLEVELGSGVVHLGQSPAIAEFLDEVVPEPSLFPGSTLERAHIRQLGEIVNSGIQPLQNLTVIQRLRDEMQFDGWKTWCHDFIGDGLMKYEPLLLRPAGAFSVGDDPSWADCCLFPQLYNARRFSVSLDAMPTIRGVEERCNEREAFTSTHPDKQPDAQV